LYPLPRRSPPGSSSCQQGGAGLGWVWCSGRLAAGGRGRRPAGGSRPRGRWVWWPPGGSVAPTGTGAGSSAPLPLTRTGGCRPGAGAARVPGSSSSHRPQAVAAAPSPKYKYYMCPGTGCNSPSFGNAPSDRQRLPSHAHFTTRPIFVPIQTGAPAQIRAADRPPATPAVLPGRYVASVNHTGLLRRSPRCSVIAHAATAVLSDRLRFCMCGLVLCGSSVGQSRRKNALPHPSRARATWLSAYRRRAKREAI
jgi:hypothetical protein